MVMTSSPRYSLENSRIFKKSFQPIRTKQFLDITLDIRYSLLKSVNYKTFELPRVTLVDCKYLLIVVEKRKFSE